MLMVGASTRSNSEMSVLAQANERQPGPGVHSNKVAHNAVVYPHNLQWDAGELFLHFARQECLSCCMPCSMLRSSLKMMGDHHFLTLSFNSPQHISRHINKKASDINSLAFLFGGDAGSWTPVLKAFTVTFYMLISRLDFSHFGTWAGLRLMSPKWQPTYRTLGWRCLFFWCRLPREQKTLGRHADLDYAARAKPILDFIVLFFAFNFSVSVLTQTSLRHAYPDSNQ